MKQKRGILIQGVLYSFFRASGAPGYFGKGWWYQWWYRLCGAFNQPCIAEVVKSISFDPIKGNLRHRELLHGCVRLLDERGREIREWEYIRHPERIAGAVNAVGLTNPGRKRWFWCWRWIHWFFPKRKVILSIFPKNSAEAAMMARQAVNTPGIMAIEINGSCPNDDSAVALSGNVNLCVDIGNTTYQVVDGKVPVLFKLGPNQDFLAIAERLRGKLAGIAINSAPWSMVFPEKPSPLEHLAKSGGGVSGQLAQPILWPMAQKLIDAGYPVIGPSAWSYEDVETLFEMGCVAVHFGTMMMVPGGPFRAAQWVERYNTQRAKEAIFEAIHQS